MMRETLTELQFGDPSTLDLSLSERARGLVGSEILKIATEIRAMIAAGKSVCNLTVGDFAPAIFPIPAVLLEEVQRALAAGETNYPPSDGMPALRQAVADYTARTWGLRYPVESVLIASGARPVLYSAYRCIVNPGDKVVYSVPSWNNNHYSWLTAARAVAIPTHMDDGFQATLDQIAPHLGDAQLLVLNTPLNPSGTLFDPDVLREISLAIVEENRRRANAGRRSLFVLYDQIYGSLVFGGTPHSHPAGLVPEIAPWVVTVDGISKSLAATGLRVGWVLAAPAVTSRMRDFIGHVGAWAPRAEQVATAKFLQNDVAVAAFRKEMDARVRERLEALYRGFSAMKADGLPVDCVDPQGAIYLSLRLDLIGRTVAGIRIQNNEGIRQLLLERAGMAAVPFQAFGLEEETGWFRISVGAVTLDDIERVFPRVRALLAEVR